MKNAPVLVPNVVENVKAMMITDTLKLVLPTTPRVWWLDGVLRLVVPSLPFPLGSRYADEVERSVDLRSARGNYGAVDIWGILADAQSIPVPGTPRPNIDYDMDVKPDDDNNNSNFVRSLLAQGDTSQAQAILTQDSQCTFHNIDALQEADELGDGIIECSSNSRGNHGSAISDSADVLACSGDISRSDIQGTQAAPNGSVNRDPRPGDLSCPPTPSGSFFDPPERCTITAHNLPGGLGPLLRPNQLSRRKLQLIHRIASRSEVSVFVEIHGAGYDFRCLVHEFSEHHPILDLHPEANTGGVLVLINKR